MTDQLSSAQAQSSQTAPGESGRSGVRVPEREADLRAIAESSREPEWRKPSFAKELYLGRFRLDLIHPHPTSAPEDVERGERSSAALRDFCERQVDGAVIERDAQIPDEVVQGPGGARRVRHEDHRASTAGSGCRSVYYNRALHARLPGAPGIGTLLCAHQSIGVPAAPQARSAPRSRSRSSFPAAPAGDQRLPAHRAGRRLRPGPAGDHRDADRRTATAYVLNGVKLWTTNGVVADLLVVMARVPASEGQRGGITAFVVEADSPGHHRRAPQRLHGPARDRERRDPLPPREGPGRERHRRRGQGPQDRSDHAQHRPAVAARDVRRRRQVVPQDRPGMGRRTRAVGPAGRRARGGREEDRLHRGDRVRPGGRCSTSAAQLADDGPQRHPDRGRPGQALAQRDGLADRRRVRPDPRRPRLRDGRLAGRPRRARRSRPSRCCATCGSTASSRARPRSCTC